MYPKSLRDRAVVHYLHFLSSLRKVARTYGVGKSTLSRWVRRECRPPAVPRPRLHERIALLVAEETANNPFATARSVVAALRDLGVRVSESTVCRARRHAGYTRKRARARYMPRPVEAETAREFLGALDLAPEAISIDETCVYVEEAPRYGYSLKGTRCEFHRRQPHRTGKVTLLLAVSEARGVVGSLVVKGSVNSASFASFLGSLDAPAGSVAILDNVRFHKTAAVREAADARGLRLLFTPPYSPEFNPVEGAFSVLKASLRTGGAREEAVRLITASKCAAFFRASRRAAAAVASSGGPRSAEGPSGDGTEAGVTGRARG